MINLSCVNCKSDDFVGGHGMPEWGCQCYVLDAWVIGPSQDVAVLPCVEDMRPNVGHVLGQIGGNRLCGISWPGAGHM